MKYPIDALFDHFPGLKSGAKPLGIWEHLDRRIYRDEMEYLETPGLPLEKQFFVVDSLSHLNHQSGYTNAILKHLSSLTADHYGKAPLKILDIGVGGGGLLRALHFWSKKKEIPVELWGLDISQSFIERAKIRLDAESIDVKFILSDACRMQTVEDNAFDVVLSNYMVHHIRSIHKVADFLSEVYRVGKRWLIVDLHRKILGPVMMKVGAAPFFPPQVLVDDGVKSIRRAYRPREINIILEELEKEGRVKGMHAKALGMLPYWMVKGSK
jgi:2-polyprenyl-3-methyl-5-hydroxy-6-metoxy-1,4-benzoquinol methylase